MTDQPSSVNPHPTTEEIIPAANESPTEHDAYLKDCSDQFSEFRATALAYLASGVSDGTLFDRNVPDEKFNETRAKAECPLNFRLLSATEFHNVFNKSWDHLWAPRAPPKVPHHQQQTHPKMQNIYSEQGQGDLWDNPSANLNKDGLTEIFNLGDIRSAGAEYKTHMYYQQNRGHYNDQAIDAMQVEQDILKSADYSNTTPSYPTRNDYKPRVTDESKKLMTVLGIDSSAMPGDKNDDNKALQNQMRAQQQLNSIQDQFNQYPMGGGNHPGMQQDAQAQAMYIKQQQYMMAMQQQQQQHQQFMNAGTHPDVMAQQRYMMQQNPQLAQQYHQYRENQLRNLTQMQQSGQAGQPIHAAQAQAHAQAQMQAQLAAQAAQAQAQGLAGAPAGQNMSDYTPQQLQMLRQRQQIAAQQHQMMMWQYQQQQQALAHQKQQHMQAHGGVPNPGFAQGQPQIARQPNQHPAQQ